MQLTQKERTLLEDQKEMEEVCIEKYTKYAQQTQCPQLKQLFTTLASQEQNHLNTVNQFLQGGQPSMSQGSQQQQGTMQQNMASTMQQQSPGQQGGGSQSGGQSQSAGGQSTGGMSAGGQSTGGGYNKNDKYMCSDLLATEKFVSGTYDIAVFESVNPAVRQALQHIQKEEQQHGEQIFQYMQSNGMYQVQ
ncbi:MAG: spore coat protein [Anaerovoracaceae bacterium]|jgi:spore coat protein CotF